MYPVTENFVSINGEGTHAGELSAFVRFRGCNLNCSYCDTRWSCVADAPVNWMSASEILSWILSTGVSNVTLTGGEPLLQDNIYDLLQLLASHPELSVEIETNGSVSIQPFVHLNPRPTFTLDYKLPSSGMESFMDMSNYKYVQPNDTIKFVSGNMDDLQRMLEIVQTWDLTNRCHVYISPVFGTIQPANIVEFMKLHKLNQVRLQLQIHKFISVR
jgi:7-carboxy-7-deazaguanine synthase